MADDCVFCKIRDGKIPSQMLHRDDTCFVIRDIAPKAKVHLLVIPIEHFTMLRALDEGRYRMLGEMFRTAAKMAQSEGIDSSGYRLTFNQGPDAGQMVDHLHLHVMGGNRLGDMA